MIRSVLGRIDPDRLGITLLHTHSSDDPEAAEAEFRAFAVAGGNTVIRAKPTAVDEVRLAEATRVNIVPLPESLTFVQPADPCRAFLEMDRRQATGVDLRNLVVHVGSAMVTELDAWCSIAVRGAWPAVDTREPVGLDLVRRLVEFGWLGQLLVATTVCGTLDATIEGLRQAGLSKDVAGELLVRNPARCLRHPDPGAV